VDRRAVREARQSPARIGHPFEIGIAHLQEIERPAFEHFRAEPARGRLLGHQQVDLQRDGAAVIGRHVEGLRQAAHRQGRLVPAAIVPDLEIAGQFAPIEHAFRVAEAEHLRRGMRRFGSDWTRSVALVWVIIGPVS
jgi:hypothetical protein